MLHYERGAIPDDVRRDLCQLHNCANGIKSRHATHVMVHLDLRSKQLVAAIEYAVQDDECDALRIYRVHATQARWKHEIFDRFENMARLNGFVQIRHECVIDSNSDDELQAASALNFFQLAGWLHESMRFKYKAKHHVQMISLMTKSLLVQ